MVSLILIRITYGIKMNIIFVMRTKIRAWLTIKSIMIHSIVCWYLDSAICIFHFGLCFICVKVRFRSGCFMGIPPQELFWWFSAYIRKSFKSYKKSFCLLDLTMRVIVRTKKFGAKQWAYGRTNSIRNSLIWASAHDSLGSYLWWGLRSWVVVLVHFYENVRVWLSWR